jgi:hypothetical protein
MITPPYVPVARSGDANSASRPAWVAKTAGLGTAIVVVVDTHNVRVHVQSVASDQSAANQSEIPLGGVLPSDDAASLDVVTGRHLTFARASRIGSLFRRLGRPPTELDLGPDE